MLRLHTYRYNSQPGSSWLSTKRDGVVSLGNQILDIDLSFDNKTKEVGAESLDGLPMV
ncbi:MAG: hypothetical protein HC880_00095 [Bacteroidia bacterium]|nr:hypothetical protein [Bacteroidia bacterium]